MPNKIPELSNFIPHLKDSVKIRKTKGSQKKKGNWDGVCLLLIHLDTFELGFLDDLHKNARGLGGGVKNHLK